ncbi:MAG: OmpW family outer membrane protein [Azonexus sp.]
MNKILVAALAMAGLVSAGAAYADDSGFMVRARAVSITWDNTNKGGLENAVPGKIEAKDLWIPEVDVSYFFNKNLALELVLTYPQTIDITVSGTKIGKVDALPPSLLLQYHFSDLGAFKPYVGAGINYTLFTERAVTPFAGGTVRVDNSSVGLAGQVGFDYFLTKNISLNVDVKYIQMSTDVKLDSTKLGKLDLNPITAGVGVGYRF